MYNAGLRKKQYILPPKLYEEKNTNFNCFKTYLSYLYRSVLSSNSIISYISRTQHFRESQIPKDQSWSFKKCIYLSMSPSYFDQSDQFYYNVCTTFMLPYLMEFFLDICFCLFLFVAFLLLCCCFLFFSLSFTFLAKILALAVKMQALQQPLLNWI